MIAENTETVWSWRNPLKQGTLYLIAQSFGWDYKPRSILATHAFDLGGIKRSWHSTEGGSVIVGVERVSVTNRYPACKALNGEE